MGKQLTGILTTSLLLCDQLSRTLPEVRTLGHEFSSRSSREMQLSPSNLQSERPRPLEGPVQSQKRRRRGHRKLMMTLQPRRQKTAAAISKTSARQEFLSKPESLCRRRGMYFNQALEN